MKGELMHKIDQKVLDGISKAHEEKVIEANEIAEKKKEAREKARAERKNATIESKNSLSGRKNGKIVYADGTEEILLYDDGIKEITERQFGTNVTEVTLPTSVIKIGYSAFSDCESLTKIEIPDSVTEIGDYAFGDGYLECVRLPDNTTRIGENAFKSWTESFRRIIAPGNKRKVLSEKMFGEDFDTSLITVSTDEGDIDFKTWLSQNDVI
jgi:hypothetical protein